MAKPKTAPLRIRRTAVKMSISFEPTELAVYQPTKQENNIEKKFWQNGKLLYLYFALIALLLIAVFLSKADFNNTQYPTINSSIYTNVLLTTNTQQLAYLKIEAPILLNSSLNYLQALTVASFAGFGLYGLLFFSIIERINASLRNKKNQRITSGTWLCIALIIVSLIPMFLFATGISHIIVYDFSHYGTVTNIVYTSTANLSAFNSYPISIQQGTGLEWNGINFYADAIHLVQTFYQEVNADGVIIFQAMLFTMITLFSYGAFVLSDDKTRFASYSAIIFIIAITLFGVLAFSVPKSSVIQQPQYGQQFAGLFSKSTNSIAYNITIPANVDPKNESDFTINGNTNLGYQFSLGIATNPEVSNKTVNGIFITTEITYPNGTIESPQEIENSPSYGDKVLLQMYTRNNSVVLLWFDWNNSKVDGFQTYDGDGSYFSGTHGNAFTGLMTEYHYHTIFNGTGIRNTVIYQPQNFIPQNVTATVQEVLYSSVPPITIFHAPFLEYPSDYFNQSSQYLLNASSYGDNDALFLKNGTFVTIQSN